MWVATSHLVFHHINSSTLSKFIWEKGWEVGEEGAEFRLTG
jgi:hypothetical protein